MQSIKVKSHVDNNGILKISLPEIRDTDVEVIIVYKTPLKLPKREWSSEFLSTFGAWEGEALVRALQEEQAERDSFL